MASIELIGNGASGLEARTIINQIITAANQELLAGLSASGQTLVITYKDGTTDTVDLSANFQEILVSGTNIKTVNGSSILGSGNLEFEGTTVLDEDDFASDSAVLAPSQQSTKAYLESRFLPEELADGTTITFEKDKTSSEIWVSGTITLSSTNFRSGAVVRLAHQATTAPTINYGGLSVLGAIKGEYTETDPATINIITFISRVIDGTNSVEVIYEDYLADATPLYNIAEDTTPQLGGNLDAQTNDIINVGNIEVEGHSYSDGEVDDGNADTTETIDWTSANFHKSTLTANCTYTFTAPSGATTLILKLVNGGAFTPTWPATVKWAGGTEPSWTASGTDIISFYYDGTNYYGGAILDLQ